MISVPFRCMCGIDFVSSGEQTWTMKRYAPDSGAVNTPEPGFMPLPTFTRHPVLIEKKMFTMQVFLFQ